MERKGESIAAARKKNWVVLTAAVRKRFGIIFAAGFLVILAGCQETPKESIVKQKGADKIKEYESNEEEQSSKEAGESENGKADDTLDEEEPTEEKEGKINEIIKAPKTYKNQAEYEGGKLVVDTDAEIILPKVDSMNTYKVSAREADQELIDQVSKIFFEGAKFYSGYDYNEWTKEDYQKDLTMLKKWKAEGNLDPYNWGTDDEGNLAFDIDAAIEGDEVSMKDAPDSVEMKEVIPSFGLEYVDTSYGEPVTKVDENRFYGVAETDHGIYGYIIDGSDAHTSDIKILIQTQEEGPQSFRDFNATGWKDGRYAMDTENSSADGETDTHPISEDVIEGMMKISYEDAEKIAKEKIDQLGWDWEVTSWNYALYCRSYNIQEEDIQDTGYIFYFTRMLDGAPITFTDSYGGSLEDHNSTLIPWSYERCEVVVGSNGIEKAEIYNPYNVEEVQTKNVKLMDFDSIIKIYEQMMEITNADMMDYYNKLTFHTRKITLGYSRIYDPTVNSKSGILVPVWDFFGGYDSESAEYTSKDSGEHSNQSFLTINAIDGTIIDRELGY